jgi:hypothetical protein
MFCIILIEEAFIKIIQNVLPQAIKDAVKQRDRNSITEESYFINKKEPIINKGVRPQE